MGKLTSADIAEIEERLRDRRAELIDAVRAWLAAADDGQPRSLPHHAGEGDERIEEMLTQDEIAMLRHELDELQTVDDAIRRIEFGVGGMCTACGAQIALARLRAAPAAALCMACASAAEKGEIA